MAAMKQPVDRLIYESRSIGVGAFRCPVGHPAFPDSGAIQRYVFVFPRRSVRLCHDGSRPFVADPNVVTLYNQGQKYSRSSVSAEGDECDWFAVDHGWLLDAVAHRDPEILRRPERPFRFPFGPCDARTYLAQRLLFEKLQAGAGGDGLAVEETVVWLLSAVLDRAYAFWGRAPHAAPFSDRQQDAADQVKSLLSERFAEPLRLLDIARQIGLSPFHLCRAFHAATGSTLHAYRDQMRLRRALDRLADGEELTGLALDLGYSSHSHFTAVFRRRFGVPPSSARRHLAGRIPLETMNTRPE
jgi:AraC family transcriptional regulator